MGESFSRRMWQWTIVIGAAVPLLAAGLVWNKFKWSPPYCWDRFRHVLFVIFLCVALSICWTILGILLAGIFGIVGRSPSRQAPGDVDSTGDGPR